MKTDFNTKQ